VILNRNKFLFEIIFKINANYMETKEMKKKWDDHKKRAEEEAKKVKEHMQEATKKTQDYIKKNPEKAAMISAGIGAAVGAAMAALMGHRRSRKDNQDKK
jgi:ElaB/YqjD/DUF883 family membrane-anchored ribosome-binding protein